MKKHRFSLIVSGVADLTPELADALYEATHGEIEFEMRNEVAMLEFERAAPTLQHAIVTAIQEVDGCNLGVRVVRVESNSANTIAKINADLLGVDGNSPKNAKRNPNGAAPARRKARR